MDKHDKNRPMSAKQAKTFSFDDFARIGDVITSKCKHPVPSIITITITTPESCAAANALLSKPNSQWKLKPRKRAANDE